MTHRLFGSALVLLTASSFSHLPQQEEHEIQGPIITVGNPKDPNSLPKEIATAYAGGARRIVIKSGTYAFKESGPAILLEGWKRARLSGHGVSFMAPRNSSGQALLTLSHCTDVEIADLSFSQTDPISCQGKVSDLGTDAAGHTRCTWNLDKGYSNLGSETTPLSEDLVVVDEKSRSLKIGCGEQSDSKISPTTTGSFSISFQRSVNLINGDWLVARGRTGSVRVVLDSSHGCTLNGLSFFRNPSTPVKERGGGGNSYYDCHWLPGPKPEGASEKPLATCNEKGFESIGAYPGPDIEGCDFAGVVFGDGIDIHGEYSSVRKVDGATVEIDLGPNEFMVGQPIRISSNGFLANGFVKSTLPKGDKSLLVTLEKEISIPTATIESRASNPLTDGQSFKVLNCHIDSTVGSGVIVCADSGFIENCAITDCLGSAIEAGPDIQSNRADYLRDLTIRANALRGNGSGTGDHACLRIVGEGAVGNRNLTIESNGFEGNLGGDLSIGWTSLASVKSNTFTGLTILPEGFRRPTPVIISHSSSVKIRENLVKLESLYSKPWVLPDKDVTDLTDENGKGLRSGS